MDDDPTGERWLPVGGYEGQYEVSDQGRVRSIDRVVNGRRLRGRVLRQAPSGDQARPTVKLSQEAQLRTWLVSHLVAYAFIGPRPEGHLVRHWNDVPTDNRLSNLLYGTAADNMQDCLRNGHNARRNRTVCPKGHKLVEPNLVARQDGRNCLACARARARVAVHRDELFEEQAELYYAAIMSGDPVPDRPRFTDVNRAKTRCKRGHLLTGVNLKMVERPTRCYRNCRSCVGASAANHKARSRGEAELDLSTLADHLYATRYRVEETTSS